MRIGFIQAGSSVTVADAARADPVTADDDEVDNASAYDRSATVVVDNFANATINADVDGVWSNVVDYINEAFAKYFC